MQKLCGLAVAGARRVAPLVFAVIAVLVFACVVVTTSGCASHDAAAANAPKPTNGDVKGCYFTYYAGSGTILFEPFLKVAEKASTSEDGEPEVWGFRPMNLEDPDEHGKTDPVNIRASRFVPMDGKFHEIPTGTTSRRVRCPPW